jgi:hypothetical protein
VLAVFKKRPKPPMQDIPIKVECCGTGDKTLLSNGKLFSGRKNMTK